MPIVSRYPRSVAITHWAMALCFALMLCSGYVMTWEDLLPNALKFQVYQWHKSLGVVLLVLIAFRVALRIATKAPALPEAFKKWESVAAKAGHVALYVCMFLMPITGWITVSSSIYGLPTIVFGLFEWPHIPGIAMNAELSESAEEIHGAIAVFFMIFIGLHIAAVVKHYMFDRINLLPRILPWGKK